MLEGFLKEPGVETPVRFVINLFILKSMTKYKKEMRKKIPQSGNKTIYNFSKWK
jgi:hypothetical protein